MATNSNTYNGWTNWETWGVHLLITNESWECTLEATRVCLDTPTGKALRGWFEDTFLTNPENDQYCYGNIAVQQLVDGALDDVNWEEISVALVASYGAEVATNTDGATDEPEDEDSGE